MWNRRELLAGVMAGIAMPSLGWTAETGEPRVVVVLLRGGVDGLAMVPAVGDPSFVSARGAAAPTETPLALDGDFALHPSMAALMPLWKRKELLVAHAVGLPYAQRSHFDAQDLLESGLAHAQRSDTGWLNRALVASGGDRPAVAVGRSIPLVLRGSAAATSVDPSRRSRLDDRRVEAVRRVMSTDEVFGPALEQGLQTRALLDSLGAGRSKNLANDASTMGRLLGLPEGPRVAVLELDGWDTHTSQERVLSRRLGELAGGLAAYAEADPRGWEQTMVVCVSEFGRTVAGNGTGGTDHGVGGAMLVLGGAVRGGRVVGDWPGLRAPDLLEGRDLRPTTDVRSVLKGVLQSQLGLTPDQLSQDVFPNSSDVPVMDVA